MDHSTRHSGRRQGAAVIGVTVLALISGACGTDGADDSDGAVATATSEATEDTDTEDPTDGQSEQATSDPAQEMEPASIRVAFGPSGGLMGIYLFGEAEGIYEEHGIDLTVEDGSGSLITAQDVAAGNSDFAMMGASAMAQGIDEGMPLVSVGAIWARPQFGILYPVDEPLQSFSDLEGKSVIVSPGSPETVLLPAALRAEGVDSSKVEIISVDAPAKASSFVQGLGDTVGTSFPFFHAIFAAQGVETDVLLFDEAGVGFPEFHVVTSTVVLEERPEMIERFLRATYQAMEEAYERPGDVIEALQAARPAVEDPGPPLVSLKDHYEFVCTEAMEGHPVGYHSEPDWTTGLQVLKEFGDISGDIQDHSRYYTNQFFEGDDPISTMVCPWPSS